VQRVSTRKVKAITEALCGHSFSASAISAINQRLDASLAQFAGRPLAEAFPYLILDARYERVREAGVIVSQAVLIAIGIDWDGRRQVLAVELANRESRSSWRDFLLGLKARVCTASNLSSRTITPGSERPCARFWRKQPTSVATCIFSETRSTTCRAGSTTTAFRSCVGSMTGMTSRRRAAIFTKWSGKYSKLTGWVEDNIDETLTFYRLPRQHHKHLKSINMLERLNEEIRRRTHVVRIFPNGDSCLRLVRALAVETHENWLEQHRYLNMDDLREHKKEALRRAA
jgi:putative transposase